MRGRRRLGPLTTRRAAGIPPAGVRLDRSRPTRYDRAKWACPTSGRAHLRLLSEDLQERLLHLFREEVTVAFPHLLGLVAHPLVDQPLVRSFGRQIRGE